MPYINVRVAGSLTRGQEHNVAAQITATRQRIAGKPPEVTYVTFDEVADENWAVAGRLLDEDG